MAKNGPNKIAVYGLLSDVTFHVAKCCAQDLSQKNNDLFPDPEIEGMLEFAWNIFIEIKKKELEGETWEFSEAAIITVNGVLVGGPADFLKWAEQEHNYENFRPMKLYETLAEEAYKSHLNSQKHDYVYMDVTIEDKPAGRLVIELFSDKAPKTSENFRSLCTGEKGNSKSTEYPLHYKTSLLHRIVKNGWVQGGDIWMKRGDGGESIYGPVFEDENFATLHSKRGIVGMANKGRHSNGSQFYITLQPAPWMDAKYVAFGQVIEGTETLKAIEAEQTQNERPLKEIVISDSGVLKFEF